MDKKNSELILTNEYPDDTYWISDISEVCADAMRKLGKLHRKYADIHKFIDAIRIYDEAIQDIYDYHGGETVVNSYLAKGIIPEGWRARPILKMTKANKEIIKSGVLPSDSRKLTAEDFERAFEISTKDITQRQLDEMDDIHAVKAKGSFKKMLAESKETMSSKRRTHNITVNKAGYAADIISEYYNSIGKSTDYEDPEDLSMEELLMREIAEKNQDKEWSPKYEEWSAMPDEMKYSYDRIMTNRQAQQVAIMKELHEAGLNVFDKEHRKSMSSDEVKLYRRVLGSSTLSDKERKKAKKAFKKYEKDNERTLQARRDSNRALSRILTGNKGVADVTEDFTIEELISSHKRY